MCCCILNTVQQSHMCDETVMALDPAVTDSFMLPYEWLPPKLSVVFREVWMMVAVMLKNLFPESSNVNRQGCLSFDLSFLPAHRKSSYWSPADITRPLSSHWHVTQDTTMTLDGGCETLVLASKGAPLSSSSSTAVSCPLRAAQWSGVRPSCGTKTVNMCRLSMLQNNDDLTLTHNGTFF